jgi:regulator of cell morphogenesis and NO signaling
MNTSTRIGEIVAIVPPAISVFEQFGIDCYRSAAQPLSDLCLAQGLSSERVLRSVEEAGAASSTSSLQKDWKHEPLSSLIEHIVQRHHQFTREAFSKLHSVTDALLERHRRAHAEMGKLRMDLQLLERELTLHLSKEEETVFPHIRLLENTPTAGGPPTSLFFRSVRHPVNTLMSVMSEEHELTDRLLDIIREIPSGMEIRDLGFREFRELLRTLKLDLLVHSCLEDYVLFPRARKLEMSHPDWLPPGS